MNIIKPINYKKEDNVNNNVENDQDIDSSESKSFIRTK